MQSGPKTLTDLAGVGPALAAKFEALGIGGPQDLLFHLPSRYEDRTRMLPLSAAADGLSLQSCGVVLDCQLRYGQRRSLIIRIGDASGELNLRLFYFSQKQLSALRPGQWLRIYGDVRLVGRQLEIVHPEYRCLPQEEAAQPAERSLTPVYPSTAGLSQNRLRAVIGSLLPRLDGLIPDFLKGELSGDLHQALRDIHGPPADAPQAVEQARDRLIQEELLAHRLAMLNLRARNQAHRAVAVAPSQLSEALRAALPFKLTCAQDRVVAEITAAMAGTQPMLRLLQGDVGAGKTVVAALAAAAVLGAGLRVIVMAPTEILARQHERNFSAWFGPLGVPVALWLGGAGKPARELPATGGALIVGTHALFHSSEAFGAVGLIVVDEQHRFGVDQRLGLRDLAASGGCYPHQLIMTATPIPRTLAQTFFADLDFSVIDGLPPGRQPIGTVALPQQRRQEVIERLRVACAQGRQAYWVSPVIEASDWAQAAEEIHAELSQALPECRIGLVHGRLKAKAKQAVMAAFAAGEVQVLVATTVIEVGVDIPNASVMVIDNAERLGLAQLHQLRGRVGRGAAASHCVLMYRPPLSASGRARLDALREEQDGFALAERDLELRGAGEILGTRQSGLAEFRIADPQRDAQYLPAVRTLAERIYAERPQIVGPLLARWLRSAQKYADA